MTTTIDSTRGASPSLLPFLDREHTVAKPGYSRWMVPPAALCVLRKPLRQGSRQAPSYEIRSGCRD
jgi:hypothetical protein